MTPPLTLRPQKSEAGSKRMTFDISSSVPVFVTVDGQPLTPTPEEAKGRSE